MLPIVTSAAASPSTTLNAKHVEDDMAEHPSIVVAGGGYSGVLAAIRAAKRFKGLGTVTLVNDRESFVERIRLHEYAARGRQIRWSIPDLLRGTNVRFQQAMLTGLDLRQRVAALNDGQISYDRLILALGSTTDLSRQPAGAREHAYVLEPGTAQRLGERLKVLAAKGGRVTVCGGGLVGVELAAEIAEEFPSIHVTLVTAGELASLLLPRSRDVLRRLMATVPVNVIERTTVQRIEATRLIADRPIAHDLCIVTAGMRALPLPGRSGMEVNQIGQVLVDPFLRSVSHPDVYVAGDAAAPVVDPGSPIAMGCKYGMPMAAVAASNAVAALLGRTQKAFDFRDTHFMVSVGRKRALVQLTHPNKVLTGRLAVFTKEMTNRSTLWAMRWERHRWFNFPYLETGHAPIALTDNDAAQLQVARQ